MRQHAMDGQNLTFQSEKCLCIECGRQFSQIKDLREHLSVENGLNFKARAPLMQNVKSILQLLHIVILISLFIARSRARH